MHKYAPLSSFLKAKNFDQVPMTFAEIEKLIDDRLPASARKHRAWWSNNPNNSVITKAWLDAGYVTKDVDLAREKLVFHRAQKSEKQTSSVDETGAEPPRNPIFGCLKGTTFIADGIDLTEPADPDWGAVYDDDLPAAADEALSIKTDPSLNVSEKIRALASIGVPRAEIAKLLGKRYQHVRNVLVDAERRAG